VYGKTVFVTSFAIGAQRRPDGSVPATEASPALSDKLGPQLGRRLVRATATAGAAQLVAPPGIPAKDQWEAPPLENYFEATVGNEGCVCEKHVGIIETDAFTKP